jgi:hypothetical protein
MEDSNSQMSLPKLAFEVWPEFPFISERLAIRDFSRLSCQRVACTPVQSILQRISAWENSRPIAASICATSLADPSRSSRAIRDACRLAGTASAEDGTSAARCSCALALRLQHGLRHFLDEQRNAVSTLQDVLADVGWERVTKPRLTCSITSSASTMLNADTRQSATGAPWSSRCRRD